MARFSVTATRGEVTGRPERPPDKFLGPRSHRLVSKRSTDLKEGKPGYQRVESATEKRQLAESTT